MGKAGGVIGIIAGVFGILAAVATLFLGGLGGAVQAEGADTVIGLGYGGIFFSFLVIVFGAVALGSPRGGGIGMLISAVCGAVLGGTLVAAFMALAGVGGILAMAGGKGEVRKPSGPAEPAATRPGGGYLWKAVLAVVLVPVAVVFIVAAFDTGRNTKTDQASEAIASGPTGHPAATDVDASADDRPPAVKTEMLLLHQPATGEYFEVTVEEFTVQPMIYTTFGPQVAGDGSVYAVLKVTARCTDTESRFYDPGDLFIVYRDKTLKFDDREIVFGLDEVAGQINPLTASTGVLVYRIPAELAASDMFWHPGRGFGDVLFHLPAQVATNP